MSEEGADARDDGAARRMALLAPLLLGLVIAAVYANGLHGGFHFDDAHVIQANPAIRSLRNLPRFFTDPDAASASPDNRVVRPLLMTTFALNYAVSGLAPWSYHVANVVLHWIACLLVFRIVRDHLWLGAQGLPVATVAALLMAAHPLNTSAVDYVSARSALLATVFYLAAFDAAVRDWRARSVVYLVLALLTKEIAVTLGLAVLAYWLVARTRPAWGFLVALVSVAVGAMTYRALLLPPSVLEAMHAQDVTSWVYCMTGWSAYLYYLRLFCWPDRLVVDRLDYPIARSLAEPQAWASLGVLVVLGVLAWRARHRQPALTFAALWIAVTLGAESTLFPLAEPVNEHRPYLAMLGLTSAAALALWYAAVRLANFARTPARATFAVVATAIVSVLGCASFERNRVWQSDYDLWIDATLKAPASTRAWTNAGHAALDLGRLDEAHTLLLTGYRLAPCYAYALVNLSALERRTGDGDAAVRWAEEAVRCNPGFALAHYYRAAALEGIGRRDEALAAFRQTVALNPRHADAWVGQAQLLEQREEWAAAAEAYDRALAADPERADAAVGAGVIYHYRLGRSDVAIERYRTALGAVPTHYGAHYQLAVALLAIGRDADARRAWDTFVPLAEAVGDRAALEGAPQALRAAPQHS